MLISTMHTAVKFTRKKLDMRKTYRMKGYWTNLKTNQPKVSQVADWSTCILVNLPKCLMENLEYIMALSVFRVYNYNNNNYYYYYRTKSTIWTNNTVHRK